jgi:hypothetical protein
MTLVPAPAPGADSELGMVRWPRVAGDNPSFRKWTVPVVDGVDGRWARTMVV